MDCTQSLRVKKHIVLFFEIRNVCTGITYRTEDNMCRPLICLTFLNMRGPLYDIQSTCCKTKTSDVKHILLTETTYLRVFGSRSLTLTDENRLRVFEKRMLRRIFGNRRKWHWQGNYMNSFIICTHDQMLWKWSCQGVWNGRSMNHAWQR
jgi:hypothetical protein